MNTIQWSLSIFAIALCSLGHAESKPYAWMDELVTENTLEQRIVAPAGFERVPVSPDSFAYWLRRLPLKEGHPSVHLYNGQLKRRQDVHAAVIDMDVGKRDLQQCADAVMRLRAEYLYSRGEYDAIHFNFTSGDRASYTQWSHGYRPVISGPRVEWKKARAPKQDYLNFKSYMQTVFIYAGTLSLSKEMAAVKESEEIQPGDVFIQGGSPGHAVMVMDVVRRRDTGKQHVLLAQSYMPAQEMHILKNPENPDSPWYSTDFGDTLVTPEWRFQRKHLKRFNLSSE